MTKKLFLTVSILASVFCSKAQTWSTYGTGFGPVGYGQVNGMANYNGNLYVTGQFLTAGNDSAFNIAQWNGTVWDSVGGGINGGGYSLCEYNGNLVLGGLFTTAGRHAANNIAQWNGTSWSALGSGINSSNSAVSSLCVFNGNLYAGGEFVMAGGHPIHNIAEWNGVSWSTLGTGITDSSAYGLVESLAVYNGELYAAGYFDTAGGVPVNNIAKWNGSSWSAVGAGVTGYGGQAIIYSLCVYEGNLYAGGVFDTAGGIPANYIANVEWYSLVSGGQRNKRQ